MKSTVCLIGLSVSLIVGAALPASAQFFGRAQAQGAPARPAAPPAGQQQAAAPAQPQAPVRTEILNFENWAVTCNEFADGPKSKRCSALLQIRQQNTGQVVFTWTVGKDEKQQLTSVIQTPSGVVIAPGVELKIGKITGQKVPYLSCDPGRCIATVAVDNNLLREMTTAPTAEAVIQATQGNTVQFNIQMKGFDRAYAALK